MMLRDDKFSKFHIPTNASEDWEKLLAEQYENKGNFLP